MLTSIYGRWGNEFRSAHLPIRSDCQEVKYARADKLRDTLSSWKTGGDFRFNVMYRRAYPRKSSTNAFRPYLRWVSQPHFWAALFRVKLHAICWVIFFNMIHVMFQNQEMINRAYRLFAHRWTESGGDNTVLHIEGGWDEDAGRYHAPFYKGNPCEL